MGWIISVGRAGMKGRGKQVSGQLLSVSIDAHGVPARIQVFSDAENMPSQPVDAVPAWQAQHIWRNVLSTLTDTE